MIFDGPCTDWLSRPSVQGQQGLSHPDSCPDVLRLLKLTLRRRLAYWKDAWKREFASTGKERDHLQVQAEISTRFQEGQRPSNLPAQLFECFNATTAAIEEDRREQLQSDMMQARKEVITSSSISIDRSPTILASILFCLQSRSRRHVLFQLDSFSRRR